MKRLAFRSAIASLTLALGVIITTLLFYQRGPSSESRIDVAAQTQSAGHRQPAVSPVSSDDELDPLEATYIKGDYLTYAGYEVERAFNAATDGSSVFIKRNGKTLATLSNGGFGKDSTDVGLFSFLGKETKQLVVLQYTGGAHCCWIYKIYDLGPKLHLIFDGEKYGIDRIGYTLHPTDIDGDGRYEFTQSVMAFDYFHMSHASSVFPTAVFAYDEKTRTYLPANRKFSSYLLGGLEKELKHVEDERAKIDPRSLNESYLSAVLRVMLKYIYAGQESDGWEFYHREYQLSDKEVIKRDIREALKSDPIYQSIYRRRAT